MRFKEAVKDKCLIKAKGYDETEWHLANCPHIYFCPFCGANVKGKGFGEYDIEERRIKLDKMVKQREKGR